MKKLTAGILVLSLLWGLCACGKESNVPAVTTTIATSEPTTVPTTLPPVPETSYVYENDDAILLENDAFRISLSKADGKVLEFYHKSAKTDINAPEDPYFTYLIGDEYERYNPTSLTLEDGRIKVIYDDGTEAVFAVEMNKYGYTIELQTSLPDGLNRIVFSNLAVNCECSDDPDSWRLSGLAMHTNTDPWIYPGGDDKAVCAMAFPANCDTKGAKLGVAFTTFAEHRTALCYIADQIDPVVGLVSLAGGAYAKDNAAVYGDYVILTEISPENAAEMGRLASLYGVDFINFHQGYGTFTQGSFDFHSALTEDERSLGVKGTAAMFKERIGDQILAQGVKLGLHTYSSLIDRDAYEILSNPKWQQQIATVDLFTLQSDLSADDTRIFTKEDASGFIRQEIEMPYNDTHTAYVLVDTEIVTVVTHDKTGFTEVVRGQLGTQATDHRAGAEIKQLGGFYGMFQPIPGSELFYNVAKWTAQAYNDGGFSYIDLDGLESMYYFCDEERYWYYLAEFVRTMLYDCEGTPVVDYSCMMPSIWNGRGREGATDTPYHGYKNFFLSHIAYNQTAQRDLLTGTLGWMSFCPDAYEIYKNCVVKTLFRDDIDLLGALSIAYDQSMIYLDFEQQHLDGTTKHAENFAYYSLYSRLRKDGYFTDAVKEQLRSSEYEHKLVETVTGYAFRQMHYESNKIFGLSELGAVGRNPFAEQTPYIRIEGRYSSLGENAVKILSLDKNADIASLQGCFEFKKIDLADRTAFRIRAYGNGQKDAAVILSIRSEVTVEPGVLDFLIPLDHTGWKEFTLIDADNGDYGEYDLEGYLMPVDQIDYETYRGLVEMDKVNSVTVTLIGNCEGAALDDLYACSVTDGLVQNPSVSIGNQTITFMTTLQGGEYIEFDPASGTATHFYYDGYTALSRQIEFEGAVTANSGEFSYCYSAEALTDAPVRAKVTIGLEGDLIENS